MTSRAVTEPFGEADVEEEATTLAAETGRRRITPKQAAVVERLLEAAAQEARERGYDHMTVRSAARRAGIAPATAYTYFASKDHLLAEVLWRRMLALRAPVLDAAATVVDRLAGELEALALFIADDTSLAAACTTALLGSGREVRTVRVRFGREVHRRLAAALGDARSPEILGALDLAYSGAMLWAGMGHMPFADLPAALTGVAEMLLGADR